MSSPASWPTSPDPRGLNPSAADRTYPRVVKRARHNSYRVKKPGQHGTRHDAPPAIHLVNPKPDLRKSEPQHDQNKLSGIGPSRREGEAVPSRTP